MGEHILKPQRILVVDDNEDIRDLVGLALGDYRIAYASDGIDGLAKTRQLRPDLVVLDIMMPRLDGFAFLSEVRKDDRLRFLKVVVLSARTMKEDLMKGLELGAIDYVTKPFKKDVLAAKVDRLIHMKFAQEIAAFQQTVWRFLNHHIRNPLNLIELSNAVFRETGLADPELGASGANIISEGVQSIQSLIEQGSFLNELMTSLPRPATVNIGAVIGGLRDDLIVHADREGARCIVFDLPAAADPLLLAGDEAMIRRALWSVLVNAVDHTPPDARIEVWLGQAGTDSVVTVTDDGPGIPPARREHLFDPYYIEWEASGTFCDRFGLSLPIAHLVARLNGGSLQCESADGEGATFIFTFPIVGTAPMPTAAAADARMRAGVG